MLAAMSDRLVDTLLAPIDPGEFIRSYWNKQPLHIRGGTRAREKIDAFGFDMADFRKAATRIPDKDWARRSSNDGDPFLCVHRSDGGMQHSHRILADQIDFAYRAGFTLQFDGLQVVHPPFALVASRLAQELNHVGNVKVYSFLSPANAGARMHFDRTPNFIIQLEGTKHWRYSKKPCMQNPPHKSMFSGFEGFRRAYPWAEVIGPEAAEMVDVTLEPGDVLHLPAGTWHDATAGDHSLAITLEFDNAPLAVILTNQLARKLMTKNVWRETPPLVDVLDANAQASIERYREACADRLVELKELIDTLTPDDLLMLCYRDLLSVETDENGDGAAAGPPVSVTDSVRPDDVLVAPHALHWTYDNAPDGIRVVIITSPHGEASVGLGALPLIERLTEVPSFRAGDATTWSPDPLGYTWEEVSEVLEILLASGLLRAARSPRTRSIPERETAGDGSFEPEPATRG